MSPLLCAAGVGLRKWRATVPLGGGRMCDFGNRSIPNADQEFIAVVGGTRCQGGRGCHCASACFLVGSFERHGTSLGQRGIHGVLAPILGEARNCWREASAGTAKRV
jgi:hypothetical protein